MDGDDGDDSTGRAARAQSISGHGRRNLGGPLAFSLVGLRANGRRGYNKAPSERITQTSRAGAVTPAGLPPGTQVLRGVDGIRAMVSDPDVDVVVSAIVGAAGLAGTWAALEAGKTVAFANKETLVMAGPLVMELARQRGGRLLP